MSLDKIVLQCLKFIENQERSWISSHKAMQNVYLLLNCYQISMCNLKNCLQVPVQLLQANGKVKVIKKLINCTKYNTIILMKVTITFLQ